MKKSFILFLLLSILLTGCFNSKKEEKKEEDIKEVIELEEEQEEKQEEIVEEPVYVDNNNTPVAFYKNKKRLDKYSTKFVTGKDIGIFQIYLSNEENLDYEGRYAENFYNKWKEYNTLGNLKIGYNLKYTLVDGREVSHTILSFSDTDDYEQFILLFLYDNYAHRDDERYSHIEEKDEGPDTLMTSIKLYPQSASDEIASSIILTVFTYDSEDDFDNWEYRGNSKFSMEICNEGVSC